MARSMSQIRWKRFALRDHGNTSVKTSGKWMERNVPCSIELSNLRSCCIIRFPISQQLFLALIRDISSYSFQVPRSAKLGFHKKFEAVNQAGTGGGWG